MDLTEVTSTHGNPNRLRPTKNCSAQEITESARTVRAPIAQRRHTEKTPDLTAVECRCARGDCHWQLSAAKESPRGKQARIAEKNGGRSSSSPLHP
jgi:hypothetical protein